MKYRYLIVNTDDNEVKGTNERSIAQNAAESMDTWIVTDCVDGKVLNPDGTTSVIEEGFEGDEIDEDEDEEGDLDSED